MKPNWTEEQNALLRDLWPTGENLKRHLKALGDRTYKATISHAHRELKLGARQKNARGLTGYAWKLILDELTKDAGTAKELSERTGLSYSVVYAKFREANIGPNGEAHILKWKKRSSGGLPRAIYAIGPGENSEMPSPMTPSEKHRLKKIRAKSNPFAAAAGLVVASKKGAGRIYIHLQDDEMEIAA